MSCCHTIPLTKYHNNNDKTFEIKLYLYCISLWKKYSIQLIEVIQTDFV